MTGVHAGATCRRGWWWPQQESGLALPTTRVPSGQVRRDVPTSTAFSDGWTIPGRTAIPRTTRFIGRMMIRPLNQKKNKESTQWESWEVGQIL